MFFLSKLCVLCLSTCKKIEPVIEKSEEILIQKKLNYCLPEIIDSHLTIPKYVCSDCINKLECFYKFKQICLQNNTYLNSYFQTLTSTAGESYKYLSVKLTDIKYQNTLQAVRIDQIMLTVGSDELRTGEKDDNGIYIKEEVVKNEEQCVDGLDIVDSHLLCEAENNIGVKEEFLISEDNADIEFYNVNVKSIICESIPTNSDVSVSEIEDIVHEDPKYSNSNSQLILTKFTEKKVTEKNEFKKTKNFECVICSKKFLYKGLLKNHLKVHAGIKDHKCSICKKRFTEKGNLVRHEKIHTDVKNYECTICKKKFIQKSSLVMHEQIHTGIKNHECSTCKKKFIQKSDLVNHEKIHTGIKNHECTICKKKFIQKSNLVKHEKIHTGNHECSTCKKKFKQTHDLLRHEKIHRCIKNYECTTCKKKFMKKGDLVKHEKIHTVNYECSTCKKKFIKKRALVRHEKIHTDIKNYECTICKKKFMEKGNLVMHEKIHTGIKNHECSICKKKFIQKIALVRHEKIHTVI